MQVLDGLTGRRGTTVRLDEFEASDERFDGARSAGNHFTPEGVDARPAAAARAHRLHDAARAVAGHVALAGDHGLVRPGAVHGVLPRHRLVRARAARARSRSRAPRPLVRRRPRLHREGLGQGLSRGLRVDASNHIDATARHLAHRVRRDSSRGSLGRSAATSSGFSHGGTLHKWTTYNRLGESCS